MKKIFNFFSENKIVHYIIILIVSGLVCIPLLKISLLGTGDTRLHLLRILGLKFSVSNSKFPYIITPFYCNNFGYATNLFYPQFTTYIPYILKIFTSSYETAMELFCFITVVLSGIFMYDFTNQITKNKVVSLISSIIYLTFPYRFENMYERFAIGEFTSLVFLPILFQGLYNLVKQDGKKHYLISIGTIGLLLSHTITTLYAAIFCVIFILLNVKDFLKKDIIKLCVINAFFILMCTLLFTAPLFEHKISANYLIFNAKTMRGTGIDVWGNSATLKQLITDQGSNKTVSFMIGIPIILYLALVPFSYKYIEEKDKNWYKVFGLMSIISIFMVTKLFPWPIMPTFLTMIQFSWRILVFFNLFVAPVCAMNIYVTLKNVKSKSLLIILLIIYMTVLVIFTSIRLNEFISEKTESSKGYEKFEEGILSNSKISPMMINREYFTERGKKNEFKYVKNREDRVYVLNGECLILNEKKDGLKMELDIEVSTDVTIELPYLYYLGYDITVDANGKINNLKYNESDNGFIEIEIPENIKKANIKIEYKGTALEKISYIASGIGLILLISYIIFYKKRNREHIYNETQ